MRLLCRLVPSERPGCSKPDYANSGLVILISVWQLSGRSSVYIVRPSVLSLSNLKLHKTTGNITLIQEKSILRLTFFNPGLALTGFRTARLFSSPHAAQLVLLIRTPRFQSSGIAILLKIQRIYIKSLSLRGPKSFFY